MPTCPAPSAKFPWQNRADSGTLETQVYPTKVRDQMGHPVADKYVPNNGADDIEFDEAELVWIAAWCSPERKANK